MQFKIKLFTFVYTFLCSDYGGNYVRDVRQNDKSPYFEKKGAPVDLKTADSECYGELRLVLVEKVLPKGSVNFT